MQSGDYIYKKGVFTQLKFLNGRKLLEVEMLIGYHKGRLSKGAYIGEITKLPDLWEFELLGYSHIPGHKFENKFDISQFNVLKLKEIARSTWSLSGPNRLVKVFPNILHNELMDNNDQYPIGKGIPQWNGIVDLRILIIQKVEDYPDGRIYS